MPSGASGPGLIVLNITPATVHVDDVGREQEHVIALSWRRQPEL